MQLHKAPLFFKTEGHIPLAGPVDRTSLYIDGVWSPPAKGRSYAVINPATEERIGSAPEAEIQDGERAIAAARKAFDKGPWPRMSMQERAVYLRRFVDWLAARSGELAGLAVAEIGVPIAMAGGMHVALAIDQMTAAIDHALRLRPRALEPTVSKLPDSQGGITIVGNYFIMYDPVGVTSLFSAYNAPLLLNGIKIIPALIAGNTAIVKGPPQAPLETLIFADAAAAAGIPPGVVNFLTGTSPEIGKMLSSDPRIDLVSFTGSDTVGSNIMVQAAPTIKRLFLELGGKSALIVRADGDLDLAAQVGLSAVSIQAGQGCMLPTRHLVHESLFEAYLERISALAVKHVTGDPSEPATTHGPLISAAQRDRVEGFVQRAIKQGAKVVFGGNRPTHMKHGFFFEPTLLRGIKNDWEIAQTEIFGPVAVAMPFRDDEEAIEIANDTIYGLSGHIVSRDFGAAVQVASRIRSGEVYINGGSNAVSPIQPFGGTKRSGFGRQGGDEGLLEYMNLKTLIFKGA
jgi:aldehyde dehydrogenase (NAD+)